MKGPFERESERGGKSSGDAGDVLSGAEELELVSLQRELEGVVARSLSPKSASADLREEWEPARERRLIASTLARTTRLDPGWRGDLRLVFGYLRDSFAQSPQLRLAAALLFVNCFVVLPAVAWVLMSPKDDKPDFFTNVELSEVILPVEEHEEIEMELLGIPEELLAAERRIDLQRNVRRVARFRLLTQVGLPEPRKTPLISTPQESDTGDSARAESEGIDSGTLEIGAYEVATVELLFDERLRLLRGTQMEHSLGRLGELCVHPVERSLLTLLALDRGVLLGRPLELGALLNELVLRESAGSADALAMHVLARARAQGEWPSEASPVGVESESSSETGNSGDGQALEALAALPLGQAEELALEAQFGGNLKRLRGW